MAGYAPRGVPATPPGGSDLPGGDTLADLFARYTEPQPGYKYASVAPFGMKYDAQGNPTDMSFSAYPLLRPLENMAMMGTDQPIDESDPLSVSTHGLISSSQEGDLATTMALPGLAMKGDPNVMSAFPVWHASPHNFEAFERGKIGTGQGAASYGRGTAYTAEQPLVSQDYFLQFLGKKLGRDLNPREQRIGLGLAQGQAPEDVLAAELQRGPPLPGELDVAKTREHLIQQTFDRVMANKPTMYKLNVQNDPEDYLHWDLPLKQQDPAVQQRVFNAFGHAGTEDELTQATLNDSAAWQKYFTLRDAPEPPGSTTSLKGVGQRQQQLEALAEQADAASNHANELQDLHDGNLTGEDIYSRLMDKTEGPIRGFSRENEAHRQQFASDALENAGIPGLRYMDQFSREQPSREELMQEVANHEYDLNDMKEDLAAPLDPTWPHDDYNKYNLRTTKIPQKEAQLAQAQAALAAWKPPTHNYVHFGPELLDILKKYGMAGLGLAGAGGAGAAAMSGGQAQAAEPSPIRQSILQALAHQEQQ